MSNQNVQYLFADASALYDVQALAPHTGGNFVGLVLRAVQSDISSARPLANTILLKYISNPVLFSVEDLKGLTELLKLAIITVLDDHPEVALSYSQAAADCVLQIKKIQAAFVSGVDRQAA